MFTELGMAQAYTNLPPDPTPEKIVDSVSEQRAKLGVLAAPGSDVAMMLIGKLSPMDLDMACVETENRRNILMADKNGTTLSQAKTLYDRALERDELDTKLELQDLRNKKAQAEEDQERADERLLALQPDLDLVTRIRGKQKELTQGYRRKARMLGGAAAVLLVPLAIACAPKDNSGVEVLAAGAAIAVGAGTGEGVARGMYRRRAHRIAKPRFEEAKANTVILKPYVG